MLLNHVVANDASFCFTCLLFLTFGAPLCAPLLLLSAHWVKRAKNDHADIYTFVWKVISEVQDLSH